MAKNKVYLGFEIQIKVNSDSLSVIIITPIVRILFIIDLFRFCWVFCILDAPEFENVEFVGPNLV